MVVDYDLKNRLVGIAVLRGAWLYSATYLQSEKGILSYESWRIVNELMRTNKDINLPIFPRLLCEKRGAYTR